MVAVVVEVIGVVTGATGAVVVAVDVVDAADAVQGVAITPLSPSMSMMKLPSLHYLESHVRSWLGNKKVMSCSHPLWSNCHGSLFMIAAYLLIFHPSRSYLCHCLAFSCQQQIIFMLFNAAYLLVSK